MGDFKQYLMSLQWNAFSRYPDQGETIYLHCASDTGEHKFLKVLAFNAISFSPHDIIDKLPGASTWRFSWMPANQIKPITFD